MQTLVELLKEQSPDRSVADVLAEILRKRILDGEYLPGERLVEAEITKLYGVSRGPVREALRRLIAEGLVEAEKHKSPVVRGIGKEQFIQIFDVRAVLEGFAARLAARKIKQSPYRKWAQSEQARWSKAQFTADDFVAANTAFHDNLHAMADHEVLLEQINQLAIPGYKAVFRPVVTPEDIKLSSSQHAAILKAILAGKEDEADRLTVAHVLDTSKRITASFGHELFDRRLRELERLRADMVA
jgi:DNA-binding GntR family transcriptional regulator